MRKCILCLFCVALCVRAHAATYDELLARALFSDPVMIRLTVEEERASIAYDRARISRDAPAFTVKSGDMTVSASGSGAALSLSPSARADLAGGISVGIGAAIVTSTTGAFARPSASVGVPLIRSADSGAVAVADALSVLRAARAARERGALALEKRLVAALKAVAGAEVELRTAVQAEAAARRAIERAVSVDGAQPGGGTYMTLERKQRAASRARRDAEAVRTDAMAALRRVFSGAAPQDTALMPESWPEPDMTTALPPTRDTYVFTAACDAANLARLKAREEGRRDSLGATAGASYGLGASGLLTDEDLADGPGLSVGLTAALGGVGLGATCGLSWDASGLSASLSLSWSPPPAGDEALRERDDVLAARLREHGLAEALVQAAADTESLESSRRDLVAAARDADEDLASAQGQLDVLRAREAKGMVSGTELEEAAEEVEVCAARVRSAALDRMAWSVDARLLTAGAEAFGGGE